MQFLTDFADQAIILPLAAMIALVLAMARWWRGLVAWVLAVGGVLGVTGVFKAICVACPTPFSAIALHSPSGHTASAALVFGGAAMVAMPRSRLVAAFAPLAFAILFGATRLVLHVHSVADVLVGGAIGITGAAFLAMHFRSPVPVRPWHWLLPLAAVLLLHGSHLPAENAVRSWTARFIPAPTFCKAPSSSQADRLQHVVRSGSHRADGAMRAARS